MPICAITITPVATIYLKSPINADHIVLNIVDITYDPFRTFLDTMIALRIINYGFNQISDLKLGC